MFGVTKAAKAASMSVRRHATPSNATPVLNSDGHARLQQLYKMGQCDLAVQHDAVQHAVEKQYVKTIDEEVDIGDAFHWGKRMYQTVTGSGQFKYVNADAKGTDGKPQEHLVKNWTQGPAHGQSRDYVEYNHNFPAFMVRKYIGNGKIDEYVTIKPLSVIVTRADNLPCFKVNEQDKRVLSECSLDPSLESHMFRINDIDKHFPQIIHSMESAYKLYEKNHDKSRPKGLYNDEKPSMSDPTFRPPMVHHSNNGDGWGSFRD